MGYRDTRVQLFSVDVRPEAPAAARKAFTAFNQKLTFTRLAELDADATWEGTHDQPGELRLVAETPDGVKMALLPLSQPDD